jgi:membrane protein implicated in regulation of membrane protease activity
MFLPQTGGVGLNGVHQPGRQIMELYVYSICLGVGFLFTLASVVFGHMLGGGHEVHFDGGHVTGAGGHAEAGLDNSGMPGVSPFSPMVIASFVAAFGGLGIIFHEIPATRPVWLSAPLSAVGAFLIAAALVWVLRKLFRSTQSSSESRLIDVVGVVGEIITPIPEKGVGEIAYVQKGARYSAPAREQTGAPVPSGASVKIVRVAGSQFYVALVKL